MQSGHRIGVDQRLLVGKELFGSATWCEAVMKTMRVVATYEQARSSSMKTRSDLGGGGGIARAGSSPAARVC